MFRRCVVVALVTALPACGDRQDSDGHDAGTSDPDATADADTPDGATSEPDASQGCIADEDATHPCDGVDNDCDGTIDENCDPLDFLTDGMTEPLVGACTVSWSRLVSGSGSFCSYTSVPTYSGFASPLDATLVVVRNGTGWTAQLRNIESSVLSPTPLAVSFPGPYVTWSADLDLALMIDGQGRARGARVWNGPCSGVCSGPIPSQTSYAVTLDPVRREVVFTVSGYLPAMPHPQDTCWYNDASLSCRFIGTF